MGCGWVERAEGREGRGWLETGPKEGEGAGSSLVFRYVVWVQLLPGTAIHAHMLVVAKWRCLCSPSGRSRPLQASSPLSDGNSHFGLVRGRQWSSDRVEE
jgi:hypothetical protein